MTVRLESKVRWDGANSAAERVSCQSMDQGTNHFSFNMDGAEEGEETLAVLTRPHIEQSFSGENCHAKEPHSIAQHTW